MANRFLFFFHKLTRKAKTPPLSLLIFPPAPLFSSSFVPLLNPVIPKLIRNPPRRSFNSHGSVNLVLTVDGKPKFETIEPEPSKKAKWKSKKRLKLQRKREKRKRREANTKDPRRIRPKGSKKSKDNFPTPEARLNYKIQMAKRKEALLVEKLKLYEVPKAQGPMPQPDSLTGEERFYLKKMAQKRSNYAPVGRRGIFGGVILNMHLHWKKHETVKVVCKPCKPGQVHEYAREIARLSGGVPIQIIGNDTIIFYRGKNYIMPKVMSPIDTLSKKRALEKSKYEQSLETVRHYIAISEKELELYYRHVSLYGDPSTRNSDLVYDDHGKGPCKVDRETSNMIEEGSASLASDGISTDFSVVEADSDDDLLTGVEVGSDDELTETGTASESEELSELEVDSEG